MPQLSDDSLSDLSLQLQALLTQQWEQEVLSHLPSDYHQQAQRLGAWKRTRGLSCVGDLLRGLLAYVLCVSSLRELGAWSVLIGLANLSHVAWYKRLQQARPFLLWLLVSRLALPTPARVTCDQQRIVLIDATRLKRPGGTGDDYRLHLGYDLLAARLLDVKLTDGHTAEGLTLFVLQSGDLVVADRGYCLRRQLAFARRQGAHVLVRFAPAHVPLLDSAGNPLDVVAWLQNCQSGRHRCLVSFEFDGQRVSGRLLAQSLPKEQAEQARAKAHKKASKQQRQLSEDTLYLCGWLLLWSSLPEASWSDEQLFTLYRARWQIELVIKRMKSVLKLAQLRAKRVASNEATLLALLVAWTLVQDEVESARRELATACHTWSLPEACAEDGAANGGDSGGSWPDAGHSEAVVSHWSLTVLCVQSLRQVVRGTWTMQRLRSCLPQVRRFLCSRRRKRMHQETCIRRQFLAPPSPAEVASSFLSCSGTNRLS